LEGLAENREENFSIAPLSKKVNQRIAVVLEVFLGGGRVSTRWRLEACLELRLLVSVNCQKLEFLAWNGERG